MNDIIEFQKAHIEALQKENIRLNDEIRLVKEMAFKLRLSDPNFNKPLSEIETNYEIIKK